MSDDYLPLENTFIAAMIPIGMETLATTRAKLGSSSMINQNDSSISQAVLKCSLVNITNLNL
jgi:hypothetical protein